MSMPLEPPQIDVGPSFPEGVSIGPLHRSCIHLAACSQSIQGCLMQFGEGVCRPGNDALMVAITQFAVVLSQYNAFYFELRLRLRDPLEVVRAANAIGNAVLVHLNTTLPPSGLATEALISAHWRTALSTALDHLRSDGSAPNVADTAAVWANVACRTTALLERLDLAWLLEKTCLPALRCRRTAHRFRWKSVLSRSAHYVRNAAITQRAYPVTAAMATPHHALVVGGGFADHVPESDDDRGVGGVYIWNTATSTFHDITPAAPTPGVALPVFNLPQRTMATLTGREFYLIGDCLKDDWCVYRIVVTTTTTSNQEEGTTTSVHHRLGGNGGHASSGDDSAAVPQTEAPAGHVHFAVAINPLALTVVGCEALPPFYHSHTTVALPWTPKHKTGVSADASGVLLSFGGVVGSSSVNTLYVLDLGCNTWTCLAPESSTAAVPSPRLYHVACSVGRARMFVFGGAPDVKTTTADDEVYDDLWRYDADENRWTCAGKHGDAPSPRGSASFHHVDSYLYLYGGFDGKRSLGDAFRYDLHSGLWQNIGRVATPGFPFWGAGSCVVSDRKQQRHTIAVVGGLTPQGAWKYAAADGVLLLAIHSTTLKLAAARWLMRVTCPDSNVPMRGSLRSAVVA